MSSLAISFTPEDIAYQEQNINDNRGAVILVTVSIISAFALLAVILRLAARKLNHAAWHLDDYIMVAAMVLAIGMWIETIFAVHHGAGQHTLKVGIEVVISNLQTIFAVEFTYVFVHLVVKVSILQLYKSIFTLHNRCFKIAWYCVLVYVVLCWITGFAGALKQCTPIGYGWGFFWGWHGTCLDLRATVIGNGVTIAVADLALLILPMPMLWTLNIRLAQKLQLSVIFAMGLVALAASVVRIWALVRIQTLIDFTFIEVDPLIWTSLEVNLGIACACIPTLRPLLKSGRARNRPSFRAKSGSTDTSKSRSLVQSTRSFISNIGRKSQTISHDNQSGEDHYSRNDGGPFLGMASNRVDITSDGTNAPGTSPEEQMDRKERDIDRDVEKV